MEMKTAYTVVQNAVAQAMGATYMEKSGEISALGSSKMIDIGEDIDKAGSLDTVYSGLISQISDIEINNRPYTGDLNDIMIKDYEWGGFTERVGFDLATIIDDPKWNLAANSASGITDYSVAEHKFYPSTVSSKAFIEAKGIQVPLSKPADQLKEAFSGWEQMNRFLSGIETTIGNTIEMGITSFRHMLVQCGIAITTGTLLNNSRGTAVHLLDLTDAAGITTATDTAASVLSNSQAIAYIMQIIKQTRDNMGIFSKAFSSGAFATFTPKEDNKLILLSSFENACKFQVRANTFNEELIGVGKYETTPSWQGIASSGASAFDFANTSKIMIAKDTSDTTDKLGIGLNNSAFTKDYCIGFMYDRKALGICPFKKKVTSTYTANADFFNTYYHVLLNTIIDPRFGMTSFFLDRAA